MRLKLCIREPRLNQNQGDFIKLALDAYRFLEFFLQLRIVIIDLTKVEWIVTRSYKMKLTVTMVNRSSCATNELEININTKAINNDRVVK